MKGHIKHFTWKNSAEMKDKHNIFTIFRDNKNIFIHRERRTFERINVNTCIYTGYTGNILHAFCSCCVCKFLLLFLCISLTGLYKKKKKIAQFLQTLNNNRILIPFYY